MTARTLGIAANGTDVFVGNWWVPYSYRLYPDRVAPNLVLPEDVNLARLRSRRGGRERTRSPLEVSNQGTAPLTLYRQLDDRTLAFSVTPSSCGSRRRDSGAFGHLQAATAKPRRPSSTSCRTTRCSRCAPRSSSATEPGLGIGKPLPETKVALARRRRVVVVAGARQGQVLAYFATF